MRVVPWLSLGLLLAAACGGGDDAQPAPADAAAAAQARAEAAYDPALFDSISWKADSTAWNRGAVVWIYSCGKCHGAEGRGDAGYVVRGDTLRPPDLTDPAWRYAEDHQALVRRIFTGAEEGMPHWGLEGLKPRDIDAVAWYIQRVMRAGVAAPSGG